MDAVFHALSCQARREMLGRLAGGDLTVGQLAEPLPISLAAVSKHVQVLEKAGLVQRTVDGRRHVCRLNAYPLSEAFTWIGFYQRFWSTSLDALADVFTTTPAPDSAGPRPEGAHS